MKKNNSSSGFDESMLPKNRKEAFFFLIKMNYRQFVSLGLLFLLFILPIIVVISIKYIHLNIINSTYLNELSLANETDKAAIESAYINTYLSLSSFYLWLTFILIVPVFIALGGVLRVIRQFIWFEPVFFKDDFIRGIKDNWKATLLWGIIIGISYVLSSYALILPNLNQYIVYLPFAFLLVVILPIGLLSIEQSIVYTESNFKYFTNSLILFFKGLLFVLLFSLLIYIPFSFIYIGELIGRFFYILFIVLFMAMVVFVLPMFLLMHLLNSFRIFDIYINKSNYPDLVDRGLFLERTKDEL